MTKKEKEVTNGGWCISARWCNAWNLIKNAIDNLRGPVDIPENPDPNNPDHAWMFS